MKNNEFGIRQEVEISKNKNNLFNWDLKHLQNSSLKFYNYTLSQIRSCRN